ncbi:MAG: DNA polymerase/3'-5' exonuclease PolX [Patescibacteria group bacterium]|nr:DNA polymerase/3'-5' exonuclease PolX [Patescibacteria group bacterium]
MENADIAEIFYEVSDHLSFLGESRFKIGAYSRAATVIENLPERVEDIYKSEGVQGLKSVPRIGESIALKVEEILKTGRLNYLDDLRKKVPPGLEEMLQVPNLGSKIVQRLHKELGISNVDELYEAAKSHKLHGMRGFGEKTEENIIEGIERIRKYGGRLLLGRAYFQAETLINHLKENRELINIEMAGSLRRMKETIGDLDILATSKNPKAIIDQFVSLPEVDRIKVRGPTKAETILKNGMEADLRVVAPESFGAALQYFTGSKNHNVHVRTIGVKEGLKINEYGVFRVGEGKEEKIGGENEEDIYKAVGLKWIPPELREDTGEIEAAYEDRLPELVTLKDLKGDLHVHTKWSEGSHEIEEMAKEAHKEGLKYIAITDHSKMIGITHGLDEKRLGEQIKRVKEIRKNLKGFYIFSGIEVDIHADGSLDLSEKILDKLDVVVASVHSRFNQSEKEMTARILKTVENPIVDIIAHPTTRLIGQRDPVNANWDRIFEKAAETKTIMEINSGWNRLDLNEVMIRRAKDFGLKFAISTDSHNPAEYKLLKFGIAMARRGWLEKDDVVNTWEVEQLLDYLNKRK